MKKIIFSLFVLFIASNFGLSQSNVIKIEQETLENGLHVIYNVDKSAPVCAVILHYKVGSKDENPQRTGFAHFFEHLMFEATNEIPRSSIGKYINEVGGELNAHTSVDETVFENMVPAHQIKLPLWIESSRMRNLQVEKEGVETQRAIVKEERSNRLDNQPYGDASEKLYSKLFKGSSYEWQTIGSADHINKSEIKEFQTFYSNFYQPNNATLAISGDIDIDSVKKYVKEYFGSIPKSKDPVRFELPLSEYTLGEIKEDVIDPKIQLPAVFVAYRAPNKTDNDAYAAELLIDILSSGASSRLNKKLVEEERIAVQVSLYYDQMEKSGAFVLNALPNQGKKLENILEMFDDEIALLIKKGVTDRELEKAKNLKETESIQQTKNVWSKASMLASYHTYYGDAQLINNEIKKYLAVTKADIKKVAEKYFGKKNRVVLNYYQHQK